LEELGIYLGGLLGRQHLEPVDPRGGLQEGWGRVAPAGAVVPGVELFDVVGDDGTGQGESDQQEADDLELTAGDVAGVAVHDPAEDALDEAAPGQTVR
jgi:hypothetical protein